MEILDAPYSPLPGGGLVFVGTMSHLPRFGGNVPNGCDPVLVGGRMPRLAVYVAGESERSQVDVPPLLRRVTRPVNNALMSTGGGGLALQVYP